MRSPADEARAPVLIALAKRIGFAIGLIAIGAVIDVIPEKLAALGLGVGICLLLAAAVAPLPLLKRVMGASSAGGTSSNNT